jgi:hypothetical protein
VHPSATTYQRDQSPRGVNLKFPIDNDRLIRSELTRYPRIVIENVRKEPNPPETLLVDRVEAATDLT